MPGIFGVIGSHDAKRSVVAVDLMADAMTHEAFHVAGSYEHAQLRLCVGWVSEKDSFAARMPVWNESRDVCLIFSGEDFRDRRDIERLRSRGHVCDPEDAGYLVHLYEELGERFLATINGWFSGVLVDLRQRRVLLFNDRYGLGRVYCTERPDGLYFASEAKALLRAIPALRRVDPAALAETFAMGCVLADRTLFPGIELLPAGAQWTMDAGRIRKDTYFQPSQWQSLAPISSEQYYESLRDCISRIVPRYRAGRRPVAMSLTGGLDSRIVMAWTKAEPGALPCYTFDGPYRECADVRIARRVARITHQPHRTIPVASGLFAAFPELARRTVYLSDGAMDVSGAVELHANRLAREIAPVRVTGNYGSEIIRRNIAFRPSPFAAHLLAPDFAALVERASATYQEQRAATDVSFVAFKQVPWYHHARLSVEQSQLTMRSPYLDNELVALMHQAPTEAALDPRVLFRLVADGIPELAEFPTDRGLGRDPGAAAARFERLYREFFVKAEYAYDYGMPPWLTRIDRLLAPLRPERLFLGRNKFYHFRIWYRDQLASYVKEVLLDSRARARPYLNARAVEAIVTAHTEGRANHTSEIHRILTAELLHRTLIDEEGA